MAQKLAAIAGLGNPGERYAATLHNAGFWCVDELARRRGAAFVQDKKLGGDSCKIGLGNVDVWLFKPQGFMNLSGQPIRALLDYYKLEPGQLLVVHDDIDLPPGTVRLKMGGGHGGHNGLRDIIRHCGADFMRLRIGVGHPGEKDRVTGYVLQKADAATSPVLERAVDDAADIVGVLADRGLEEAMKELHTRSP